MERRKTSPIRCDVVVVGAGPAGLGALAALEETGLTVLVVESGPDLDERDAAVPEHRARGVGGAGLFSDGKFSFYPSASALWRLHPAPALRQSYAAICAILAERGLDSPAFPQETSTSVEDEASHFRAKRYESGYLSLEARYALTRELATRLSGRTIRGAATGITANGLGGLDVTVRTGIGEAVIQSKAVIYAAGRFGPLSCRMQVEGLSTVYRRVEIGIRIEQPSETFFLRSDPAVDSKYLCSSEFAGIGWRTFCCCRDGKVVVTDFDEWRTLSGRADCPPTGLSNVGFNLRITSPDLGSDVWRAVTANVRGTRRVVQIPLVDVVNPGAAAANGGLAAMYGDKGADALVSGLRQLVHDFGPRQLRDAVVHGPCIEGVGSYIHVDDDLRAAGGAPIWFAGDSSGIFRGLTAALVSGYYVGLRALTHLRAR
ncbi:hypothetical protein GA0070610_1046 [Micromonospora echinofusca]|uniref:Uncharacterized protein n=1 Tax=Micromonospora echinofusca TaxID=47858 RepID=A0A1C5G534_MICEH|nr:FAD-binding protein [Micromonospora echinofusca]SCG14828.1 hypothetical protein GA0070610_1046 [Micromonospora echinofusca]